MGCSQSSTQAEVLDNLAAMYVLKALAISHCKQYSLAKWFTSWQCQVVQLQEERLAEMGRDSLPGLHCSSEELRCSTATDTLSISSAVSVGFNLERATAQLDGLSAFERQSLESFKQQLDAESTDEIRKSTFSTISGSSEPTQRKLTKFSLEGRDLSPLVNEAGDGISAVHHRKSMKLAHRKSTKRDFAFPVFGEDTLHVAENEAIVTRLIRAKQNVAQKATPIGDLLLLSAGPSSSNAKPTLQRSKTATTISERMTMGVGPSRQVRPLLAGSCARSSNPRR